MAKLPKYAPLFIGTPTHLGEPLNVSELVEAARAVVAAYDNDFLGHPGFENIERLRAALPK